MRLNWRSRSSSGMGSVWVSRRALTNTARDVVKATFSLSVSAIHTAQISSAFVRTANEQGNTWAAVHFKCNCWKDITQRARAERKISLLESYILVFVCFKDGPAVLTTYWNNMLSGRPWAICMSHCIHVQNECSSIIQTILNTVIYMCDRSELQQCVLVCWITDVCPCLLPLHLIWSHLQSLASANEALIYIHDWSVDVHGFDAWTAAVGCYMCYK